MTFVPPWIDRVLAAGAVIDLHHPDGRAELAARILAAIPSADIVTAIAGSAKAVIEQRWSKIASTAVSTYEAVMTAREDVQQWADEIGHNAAQTVLCVLEAPLVDDAVTPAPVRSERSCTCLGECRGAAGLAPGWRCALDQGARP